MTGHFEYDLGLTTPMLRGPMGYHQSLWMNEITHEHVGQFLTQLVELANNKVFCVCLFLLSLTSTTFACWSGITLAGDEELALACESQSKELSHHDERRDSS
ncbi:hypothetical protein ACJX0J_027325, partial [Zea mays]